MEVGGGVGGGGVFERVWVYESAMTSLCMLPPFAVSASRLPLVTYPLLLGSESEAVCCHVCCTWSNKISKYTSKNLTI